MTEELAALAALVRDARRQRKWGQQDLASAAGVSLGVISNLERGKTRPQPANERAIMAALELNGTDRFPEPTTPAEGRRDWPNDVAVLLDVIGLVVSSIPEGEERTNAIHDITRYTMGMIASRREGHG